MTELSRALGRAARRNADAQTARLAEIPAVPQFFATITTVTAGAGPGGNALVKVTWRAAELTVASYNGAYTPVLGHRVKCSIVRSQLVIDGGPYIN